MARSDISGSGDIVISALTAADILAVTGTFGIGNKGMALAASASVNVVTTETVAFVTGKKISGTETDGTIAMTADERSDVTLIRSTASPSRRLLTKNC